LEVPSPGYESTGLLLNPTTIMTHEQEKKKRQALVITGIAFNG
jgi:hypothetical protein